MKDEIKEDEFIKNNRKFFNYLINLRNRDLRKEIENCNWNAILQLIRYCGYEITNLQEENEKLKAYIKYLEEYKPNYYKGEKIYGIDYKSRIDKAIELINAWLDGFNNDDIIILLNNLGNILNGSDE